MIVKNLFTIDSPFYPSPLKRDYLLLSNFNGKECGCYKETVFG